MRSVRAVTRLMLKEHFPFVIVLGNREAASGTLIQDTTLWRELQGRKRGQKELGSAGVAAQTGKEGTSQSCTKAEKQSWDRGQRRDGSWCTAAREGCTREHETFHLWGHVSSAACSAIC